MSPGSPAPEVLCVGELRSEVVVHGLRQLPVAGQTVSAPEITFDVGGAAFHQAVVLRRLGRRVGVAGRVGDDVRGRLVVQECQDRGIDAAGVRRSDLDHTVTSIGFVNTWGERATGVAEDETRWAPDEVPLETLAEGTAVLSLVLPSPTRTDLRTAVRRAADVGARTILTLDRSAAVDPDLDTTDLDVVVVDWGPAGHPTADDPFTVATAVLDRGARYVVLAAGRRGSFAVGRDATVVEVEDLDLPVVDTTGSTGAFTAGLALGLLHAKPLAGCLRFAAAVRALVAQSVGPLGELHDEKQVLDLLAHGPVRRRDADGALEFTARQNSHLPLG